MNILNIKFRLATTIYLKIRPYPRNDYEDDAD